MGKREWVSEDKMITASLDVARHWSPSQTEVNRPVYKLDHRSGMLQCHLMRVDSFEFHTLAELMDAKSAPDQNKEIKEKNVQSTKQVKRRESTHCSLEKRTM